MGERIECPKCGRQTILNKNGNVRYHFKRMQKKNPSGPTKYCEASGKPLQKLTTRLKVKPKPKNHLQNKDLSPRQLQVLDLIVKGFSHKETGYILNISHRTVDNHIAKMKKILKINDRYDLLRWGLKHIK